MPEPLRLGSRLRLVAETVPVCRCAADIGTDHGLLPVFLLKERRAERVIATDLHEEPLRHAMRTAAAHGLSERIAFRLCDGLDGVSDADGAVLAGMGGETIAHILENAPAFRGFAVVQAMTKTEEMRARLAALGWLCGEERLVRERGVLYSVALLSRGEPYTPDEETVLCGALSPRDPLFGAYIREKAEKTRRAIEGLSHAEQPEIHAAALDALKERQALLASVLRRAGADG